MRKSGGGEVTPRLPIGLLSQRTGCNIETIRYYERVGLLATPTRSSGGHRMYNESHLMLLSFVLRARDLGFTLDEVRALPRLAYDHDRHCAHPRNDAPGHLSTTRSHIT